MFGIELQDVIIAVVFFALGVAFGALGRCELRSIVPRVGKKRHDSKKNH